MNRGFRRRGLGLRALEHRFMFDAAIAESTQEPLAEGFDALHALQFEESPLFLVPPSLESFQEVLLAAERSIKSQLSEANAQDLLQLFPGAPGQDDAERTEKLGSALGAILNGELGFSLLPMEGASRATAISAFSADGPGGAPTIFVNPFWFESLSEAQATSVLLEEIGHALDNILNGESDSPGDEGRAFARAVLGFDALEPLGLSNDHGTVTYGGLEYAAEFASFSFVNAYEMLTDRDGDDTVDNTENWAEKEQETHTLIVANNGTDADKGGLGAAIINDDTDSASFSGNDVVAIGIDIDGTTYFGWISRPLKVQGEVVGFYFWTDQNFTTLALAQADGNQDGDRNVTDNKGFILVVDQSYFTDKIAAGLAPITVQASSVYSAQPAGTYNSIEVKSSSDRVDAQLNAALASNSGPTGVDDTTSGTPDASIAGRPALEQGFDLNTGVNAEISAGQDATGNVLTNDSDADGDTLQVASVQSDFSGSTAVPTTSTSAVAAGRYGTLTLSQSGAYRYVVDNANSDVNRLLSGSLSESFTYTLSDGNSGSDTATLTVTVNGANDAPLAEDDVALAKETLTDGNGVVTLAGFSASGDVLSNDEDADSGDSLSIAGLATSGQIIGTTQGSSSQSATTLSFSSDISTSIKVGHYVFFEASGVVNDRDDSAFDLETSSGTHIQVAAIDYASRTITLSDVADSRFNLSSGAILGFSNQSNGKGSYKDAAIAGSTNQTTTTFLVDVGGSSGTVAVGMDATATGLEAGVKVTAANYDGSGVLVSVKLSTTTVLTNTTVSLSGSGAADQQFIGAHGVLLLQGNGTYTYTPFEDNPAIAQGDSVIDRFTYSSQDLAGETSSAELVVTVLGASTSDVVAVADTATVYESGVGRQSSAPYTVTGDNSVFAGVSLTVSAPGVLDNDSGGTVVSYARADGTGSKLAGDDLTGAYGTLAIQADGSFTYLLDNSLDAVNGLLETESLTETFRYSTTSNGASTLSISIIGTNDAPVAVDDPGSLTEDTTVSVSGNALANDSDVDANDRFTVTAVGVASADQSVSPGTVFSNGTSLSGTYGSLSLGADGSYVYTLADSSDGARYALLQALADGQTVQDSFVYEITDLAGATDTAALTFSIAGANEPPVNSVPTSVTGALNSAINFTGANLVSVADDDGNLNRVTLEVDNGDLNLTADGSLVLSLFDSDGNGTTASGNATVRATLVGTQAEINNTLATLSYTPDAGFSGTDFLTIVSQDAKDAFDSDSVQLLVPTSFVGPTVLESDLGTGSNPSGAGEAASLTLNAPSSQTFGTVDQTGTDSYGSWSLTTAGVFTYTLTSAPTVSGATEVRSIEVQTFDDFGNSTSNSVSVTITNDSPTANADGASVTEGTSGSPAANITGNVVTGSGTGSVADTASADTPLTVTKVGTTSADGAVTAGTTSADGTSVVGSYGTLVLGADGSYSYDLDDGNATVDALATGSTLQDVFRYEATDGDGDSSVTTLTITIDGVTDISGSAAFSVNDVTVNEGSGTATFTVTKTGSTSLASTVDVSFADVTAVTTGTGDELDFSATATTLTFAAGETTKSIIVTINDDGVYEGSETFQVNLANATGATISDAQGIGTILDDGTGGDDDGDATDNGTDSAKDDDRPSFSIDDVTVNEGAGTATFTVTKTGSTNLASTVDVSFADATAVRTGTDDELDFSATATTLTFGAGETTKSVVVTINDDGVYEGSETFQVNLANATGATISDAQGIGTILDDGTGGDDDGDVTDNATDSSQDDDRPSFSINDVTVNEGAGTATFTVTKTGSTNLASTVDVSFSDATAVRTGTDDELDFSATATTLTFGAGETTKSVVVTINDDGVYEGSETFQVNLANATGATISDAQGIGTILDDGTGSGGTNDDRPSFSIDDVTVNEGAGTATFTVTKTGSTKLASTVDVSFADATAVRTGTDDELDFSATATTLTFGAGETTKSVVVTINDDGVYEGSETFQVNLANANGATISDAQGIGTILDDGTGGDDDGDATDNGTDSAKDDDRPSFSIDDVTVNEGAGTATFTVTKTGSTNLASTVDVSFADATAVRTGSDDTLDFSATATTLTFAAGDTTTTVTVTINDDGVYEGSETFQVNLANATAATISDAQGIGTILDDGTGGDDDGDATDNGTDSAKDDDRPSFSIDDVTVNEGAGTATFTVTKTGSTNLASTVDVSFADATAVRTGSDDTLDFSATATTLTFAAGDTTKTVTVTINDDGVYEGSETFQVNLANATAATISDAQGIGTILDDGTGSGGTNDDRPTFSIDDVTVNEGAGTATFTVTKTGSTNLASTVDVSFADVTAVTTGTGDELDFSATAQTLTFAAGDTTKTVTVTINDDGAYEGSETFQVNLANATGATISDAQGIGTILDDGTGSGGTNDDRPSFSIDDVTVNEGAGTATFTVTKTGSTNLASTVDVSFADATAVRTGSDDELDFSATATTLTFAAGDTTKTVTVTINDDGVYEGSETFQVNLANATGATISDAQGIGTILDDGTGGDDDGDATDNATDSSQDDDRPSFSINDVTVNEGAGTATFTVTKTGSTKLASTVDVSFADVTAVTTGTGDELDFSATATTLTFAEGDTTKTVTVTINDDGAYEGSETFQVNLANATGATISDAQGIGTILDDGTGSGGTNDDRPSFSIDDATVNEGAGTATFTVTKTGSTKLASTVDVSFADATAVTTGTGDELDFSATAQTLTFAAGDTTKTVTVTINDDGAYEGSETFKVDLANATAATISDAQGIGTILDDGTGGDDDGDATDNGTDSAKDDDQPSFSIDDVTVNEGAGTATFTVTKTGSTNLASTVDVSFADATAVRTGTDDELDFSATATTLTFAAGDTTKTVTVTINDDGVYEGSETFEVNLANATGATISDAQGIGTILDDGTGGDDDGDATDNATDSAQDDDRPSFSINDVTVNEGAGTATFTVTKTGSTNLASTVDVSFADATAVRTGTDDELDFSATATTLNFAASDTTKTVTVTINDDGVYEGSETFEVDLANATAATISDAQGIGTILDDGTGSGGTNDDRPSFSIDDVTVNEGAGTATFTVTKTGSTNLASTVDVSFADATAVRTGSDDTLDFSATAQTLTFAAGDTTKTVTVTINDDGVYEGSETFQVNLANATGATISDAQGIGTILDDGTGSGGTNDDRPSFSIDDVTVNEGAGTATFTVTKTGSTNLASTVDVSFADATAVRTGSDDTLDFSATAQTLTFAAGDTTKTVTVTINDDGVYEGSETFQVNLANATGATISDAQGIGTILDDGTGGDDDGDATDNATDSAQDDDRPSFSINDVTVNEGAGTATFTVTKTGSTNLASTVDVSFADVTAVTTGTGDELDFSATATTLTFAAGETTKSIIVTINDDGVYEGSEAFEVNLANATGATISDAQGIGTILDDGTGSGGTNDDRPSFSINDVTVNEGAGTATFTVTKTGSTNLASTVDVSFADATAVRTGTDDELDFSATATTLNFAAGDTTKTVTVTINDDGVYEGSETFQVNLANATGATISDAQGIGTILDDGTGGDDDGDATDNATDSAKDDDRPSFSINDVTVNEGAGTATFTVTKTGSTNLSSTVDVSFADATAVTTGTGDELDFSATAQTLTFAAGETIKSIIVTINDDGVYEGSETLQVDLANATGATISDAQGIGTILDDGTGSGGTNDDRPSFSIDDVTVNEGAGTATFTVTKTGSTNLASTVDLSFADATAVTTGTGDELDFSATAQTLTFAAGDTTKTVTVTINDDGVYEGSETFQVNLANATGATISDAQGIGTILDDGTGGDDDGDATDNATDSAQDDDRPSFSINDVTVNEGAGTATFTVTKTGSTNLASTVDVSFADATAVTTGMGDELDFSATATTLTFVAGDTTKTVTVTINDDGVYEGSETFEVNLANATAATISDAQGIGTILDDGTGGDDDGDATDNATDSAQDDDRPSFSINDVTVNEAAGTATFVVTKAGLTKLEASVEVSFADDTAVTTGRAAPAAASLTEGALRGIAGPSRISSMALDSGDKLDYQGSVSSLVFAPGESSKLVTVQINNDGVFEGAESFFAQLSKASGSSIADPEGIGTILDDGQGGDDDGDLSDNALDLARDDDRPVFSVDGLVVNEAIGTAFLRISKLGLTNLNATVSLAFLDGSALSGGILDTADYEASPAVLRFAPSQIEQLIPLKINDDGVFEGREAFTAVLGDAENAKPTSATAEIVIRDDGAGAGGFDDDREIEVVGLDDVSEGSPAVFRVTLPQGNDRDTKIALTLISGSASEQDYASTLEAYFVEGETLVRLQQLAPGQFVLPEGVAEFLVRVATLQDTEYEVSEIFTMKAEILGGASDEDTATIVDDGSGRVYDQLGQPLDATPDNDTPPPPEASVVPPPPTVTPPVPTAPVVVALTSSVTPVFVVPSSGESAGEVLVATSDGNALDGLGTGASELRVARDIPQQEFSSGISFIRFAIPTDTFAHSDPSATVQLQAVMVDGAPLPPWLQFNPELGEFTGIPPEGLQEELVVRVLATDDQGLQAETTVRVRIGAGSGGAIQEAPQGRQGLSSQLRELDVFSWKADRDRLIQLARDLRETPAAERPSERVS